MGEVELNGRGDATGAPRSGDLVAGKYCLEGMLGAGSMGSVWRAVHVVLGHSVAVKFLNHSLGQSASAHARFEQEAKVSARLGEMSNHIARVSDYGVLENDMPFVVMELLRGESLAQRLNRDHALPLVTVATIVQQLARALAAAHKAGVVHRDLKPGNVFLCATEDGGDPLVKLLDFGVAKLLEDDGFQPTMSGEVVGTPSYMSPEQIGGVVTIDARTDLWALAAITYRMAVGRNAFGTGQVVELVFRITSASPPAPSSVVPSLPPELDAWIERGLAKRREDRFQTAREMADALSIVAGLTPPESTLSPTSTRSRAVSAVTAVTHAGAASPLVDGSVATHTVSASHSMPAPRSRGRSRAVVAAAMLVVAAGGAGLWTWRRALVVARGDASPVAAESASAAPVPVEAKATALPAPSAAATTATPEAREGAEAVAEPSPVASVAHAVVMTPATVRKPVGKAQAQGRRGVDGTTPATALEKQADELWRKNDEL